MEGYDICIVIKGYYLCYPSLNLPIKSIVVYANGVFSEIFC